MAKTINFTQILNDEASFQLIRTNPKLTGNVKFTVDSNDNMWLNSIDANEELSKSMYKRVPIDPSISLPGNIFKFFAGGETPSEIVFDLNESHDSTKASADFKDQYDFSNYFSGVKYLPSRRYQEKLSYFAPIYLKKDLPEYFVVFKIEDPLNKNIEELQSEYPYNREEYIKELFKKSTIIKTFDLRPSTKIGKYLKEYIEDPLFPKNPLDVTYEEDRLTNFNGILYDAGVLGSRGEDLYSLYQSSNPLKYFEEFITLGFERNSVIFPNIVNMEFIFDDDTSGIYDFNRYLGVYVNAIELSKLDIDLDRAYQERSTWENSPRFRKKYYEWEDVSVNQANENGVIIPVKELDVYLSDFEDIFSNKNSLFFNYITDKTGSLHLPKLDTPYNIDYDSNLNELKSSKIRMSNKSLDIGKLFGPGPSFLQDRGRVTNNLGNSHAYIQIKEANQFDSIKIYYPLGSRSDAGGKYDIIEGVSGYTQVPNPGDYYIYNDIDNVSGYNIYYVNNTGSPSEIASAIVNCINGISKASFKATQIQDHIFIKVNSAGDFDNLYGLEYQSSSSNYESIVINDTTGSDLNGSILYFEGGSRVSGNRLIVNSEHLSKIKANINDILVKTVNGWSNIKKVSKYIDSISESNLTTNADRASALNDFFNNIVITLENSDAPLIEYGEFKMVQRFRPGFGLLSMFPIKDFDFDFYSSEYLNFPKIDLHQYYYIPEGLNKILPNIPYKAYGTGEILLSTGEVFNVDIEGIVETSQVGGPYSYQILEGDVIIEAQSAETESGDENKWAPLYDSNGELKAFEGFFLIKDPDLVISESSSGLYTLRDKYLNGLASSEYDFYKENSSKDFALKSKIIPYITKWVIPDGFDSRSNPYRLNGELVFGFNNFSPDHEDRSQNPSNFTHEWYYIESLFEYSESIELVKQNNSYFPYPFDLDKALSQEGYFIDYFTYSPTFNGEEVGRTQTRYSPILKNNQGVYEAFFKGFKIQFKDYIDPNNLNESGKPEFNPNSNRFEDYKFSCLLKPIKDDINDDSQPPIRYRFIEHTNFKFVLLLIELRVNDLSDIDEYWSSYDIRKYLEITNQPSGSGSLNFLNDDAGQLSTQAYDSINGDYRIKFNDVDGLYVSNITHTLLYSLRHKKFNNNIDNFSTVKLSSKLNLKTAFTSTPDDSIVKLGQNVATLNNYPSKINEELHNINEKTFLIVRDNLLNEDRIVDNFPGSENKMIQVSENYIKYDESSVNGGDINLRTASNGLLFQTLPSASSSSTYALNNYVFKVMAGGELYFETLFEKLSFGEFKDRVNNLDPFVEYETYQYAGSVSQLETRMYCEIPNQSSITKIDSIITNIDEDKPSNLSFSSVIGFNYQKTDLDNTYDLNRYEGGFAPLFKDLIFFNSKFNFVNNDISSLDLSNTRFNINIESFMRLNHFSHIKVSNTKILDLESDEQYDPLYELAGEIAIGKNQYNLLHSNWDWGFHQRYIDKTQSTPVPGSLRIEEDESFIGKIINVRENIELEDFNVDIVDRIDSINIDNHEIVYQINDNNISGNINVESALVRYLISDGITNKFQEFLKVSPEYIGNYETLEDYVREYINLNITKLYEILEVEFYAKDDRTLLDQISDNKNAIEFVMLDDKSRLEQGFEPIKNLQINKIDRFLLNFEFSKKVNSGILISPKIKIRFI